MQLSSAPSRERELAHGFGGGSTEPQMSFFFAGCPHALAFHELTCVQFGVLVGLWILAKHSLVLRGKELLECRCFALTKSGGTQFVAKMHFWIGLHVHTYAASCLRT